MSTSVPSGTCLIHGSFAGSACPYCSSVAPHPHPSVFAPSPEQPEYEEARRLGGKLLTENERELAKASWAYGVVADPNIPKWGNLVLEAYDAAAALLASLKAQLFKAEQERDDYKRARSEVTSVALMHRDERDAADSERDKKQRLLEMEQEENGRLREANDELGELRAKAEQERDEKVRELEQARAGAFALKLENDEQERELERLRDALHIAGQWVADAADHGDQIAEQDLARIRALSADTQREDG